jgi:hypothetical protein
MSIFNKPGYFVQKNSLKTEAESCMMAIDDGRMTETCCGNNIGRGEEEELLRSRTHNCFVNV